MCRIFHVINTFPLDSDAVCFVCKNMTIRATLCHLFTSKYHLQNHEDGTVFYKRVNGVTFVTVSESHKMTIFT